MNIKRIIVSLAATLLSFAAHATPTVAPDDVVKGTTDQLQLLIARNHVAYQADLPVFYKVVDDTLAPHFDQAYIGKLVLARHWKTATQEQRSRFQIAFKNMMIRAYASSMLKNYDSVKAEWLPLRMTPMTNDVAVHSKVMRNNGRPLAVSFMMHIAGDQWRIYDIQVENLSLVSNFRAQFASEIKKNGIESVIARLESGELVAAKPPVTAK